MCINLFQTAAKHSTHNFQALPLIPHCSSELKFYMPDFFMSRIDVVDGAGVISLNWRFSGKNRFCRRLCGYKHHHSLSKLNSIFKSVPYSVEVLTSKHLAFLLFVYINISTVCQNWARGLKIGTQVELVSDMCLFKVSTFQSFLLLFYVILYRSIPWRQQSLW